MSFNINTNYPSIEHLRVKAQKRMPKFSYEYLTEGCNDDLNVYKNTKEIRDIELLPQYLNKHVGSSTKKVLFGHEYDAPIGICPVGLQSLMWPKTAEILAKTSVDHNIPFMLSTVTTLSIEKAAKITNGNFWYQLYHPADNTITDDILKRAKDNGCNVLVLLADVPTFGYRPKDIYNGLGMPPKMMLRNIIEVMRKPQWAFETLINGIPSFDTMEKYMPKGMDLQQLGSFMDATFSGRLNIEKIKRIQDRWDGKIIIKGIASCQDAQKAVDLGIDGIIVSNHGGRQLDAGPSSIKTLHPIVKKFKGQIQIMMDGGMRTGPDVARVMASGADFTFLGRPFMYGTGALGKKGGDQVAAILKREFQQVMEQICCEEVEDLPNFLIKK
ncbi:L-lactate dehydrogenase (Cytochrome) [Tenacibaculum dicentrarchi]|uniref:L-lactate dehydrogenase (Cytochrome) n=1 Tax=Tenacibaculum dicentrarchi TaxID=669041 RepID=A0ABM9NY73_9FLAO|nr:L-lactate dehydrogenase (Cytochrome) [Tenacibaculum dicentrarchi]